ncbi:hypothetical protein, partial [Erwinia amylovora]|uniref:hypothetical protein n=1 Tax=Erwinia amylovora TaxID=552 RepID=UPI0020BE1EBF
FLKHKKPLKKKTCYRYIINKYTSLHYIQTNINKILHKKKKNQQKKKKPQTNNKKTTNKKKKKKRKKK